MIRLSDAVSRNANIAPDAPAVSGGGRTYNWAELERRLWSLAAGLQGLGIQPGDRVAFLGLNAVETLEVQLGAPRAGAIYVPVNYRFAQPEMIACLLDCTPRALIVDHEHLEQARALREAVPSLETLVVTGADAPPADMIAYDSLLDATLPPPPTALGSRDDDIVALYYTSGTTGQAKGVMLTHNNLLANVLATSGLMGLEPGASYLLVGPLFHLAAAGRIYANAIMQVHTVIRPRFDVLDLLETVEAQRIEAMVLVPTMLSMLLDHEAFASEKVASIRLITYGAAPMPPTLMRRALEAMPDVEFLQSYGMTEASPVLSALTRDCHREDSPWRSKLASVGRPLLSVDLRIVDENGRQLRPGQVGEIVARGPNIMKGYWGKPDLTAEVIRDGFYQTGDAGYLDDDGFLYLAGRTKEMIITGAENVYPLETENALAQHPAVAQCAVLGRPDPHWGERVHAVVSLKPGAEISEADLIAFSKTLIAGYKCPKSVSILTEPLPLGSTNKIDKGALRRWLDESAADSAP